MIPRALGLAHRAGRAQCSAAATTACLRAVPFSTSPTPEAFKSSSSSKPRGRKFTKGSKPDRKATSVPAWKQRERQIQQEIRELEQRIKLLDKQEQAEEAAKDLPELDDELLDQIYAGVKEGEPLPAKERQLLANEHAKRLERYARVTRKMKEKFPTLAPPPPPKSLLPADVRAPLSFSDRMQGHLEVLSQRLQRIAQQTQTEGQPSGSATQQSIADLTHETDILKQMLQTVQSQNDKGQIEGDEQTDVKEGGQGYATEQGAGQEDDLTEATAKEDRDKYTGFQTLDFAADTDVQGVDSQTQTAQPFSTQDDGASNTAELVERLSHLAQATEDSKADQSALFSAVSPQEWFALGTSCASGQDTSLLQKTMTLIADLAEQEVVTADSFLSFHEAVADSHADRGDVEATRDIAMRIVDGDLPATGGIQHALVKSYLRWDPTNVQGGVETAMAILSNLEEAGEPAPQATYTLVISHLVDMKDDPQLMDEAWGVWNRMRLNAYPTPDAVAWSSMLRACAKGSSPSRHTGMALHEAHKGGRRGPDSKPLSQLKGREIRYGESQTAMDLFKEMTVVEGVRPNPACYDYLILACSKSQDKGMYLEGFRLLEEMIATAKELQLPAFEPTNRTYNALLAGCNKAKDLLRARWVLAEMIRSSAPLWSNRNAASTISWEERANLFDRAPDAQTLGQIFLTYAAWRPPKVQFASTPRWQAPTTATAEATVAATEDPALATRDHNETFSVSSENERSDGVVSQPQMDEAATSFSAALPSTSGEVVREVRGLVARVIVDQMEEGDVNMKGPMSAVRPSTQLLNSYLYVLNAHLPATQLLKALASAIRGGADSLYGRLGVEPDAYTYLTTMEYCGKRSYQGAEAKDLCDWAWGEWRVLEGRVLSGQDSGVQHGVDRRSTSRCWSHRICFLAKTGALDEAMSTLREFVALYPPTSPPSELRTVNKRRMPYFDFASIKAELEERRHTQLEKLKAILERVQQSWTRAGLGPSPFLLPGSVAGVGAAPSLEAPRAGVEQQRQQRAKEDQPVAVATSAGGSNLEAAERQTQSQSSTPMHIPMEEPRQIAIRRIFSPRPPSMSFYDLGILHQRLVQCSLKERPSRDEDVRYLTWCCKKWEKTEKES